MHPDQGFLTKTKGVSQDNTAAKTVWLPSAYAVSSALAVGELASRRSISRNPLLGFVELRVDVIKNRKKTKRAIPIPDDQAKRYAKVIQTTETVLSAYDAIMRDADIQLGNEPVYPAMTSMVRVFSRGDMKLGGRLYSSIQNLKSEARMHIRFNGDPVVEIDYSAINSRRLKERFGIHDGPSISSGASAKSLLRPRSGKGRTPRQRF